MPADEAPPEVVLRKIELSPADMATLMRFKTRLATDYAVQVLEDQKQPVDTRLRAAGMLLGLNWGKAPSDPQTLIQIANTGTQPAAAGMEPERLRQLQASMTWRPRTGSPLLD